MAGPGRRSRGAGPGRRRGSTRSSQSTWGSIRRARRSSPAAFCDRAPACRSATARGRDSAPACWRAATAAAVTCSGVRRNCTVAAAGSTSGGGVAVEGGPPQRPPLGGGGHRGVDQQGHPARRPPGVPSPIADEHDQARHLGEGAHGRRPPIGHRFDGTRHQRPAPQPGLPAGGSRHRLEVVGPQVVTRRQPAEVDGHDRATGPRGGRWRRTRAAVAPSRSRR